MDADYVALFGFFALSWVTGFTVSYKILTFKRFTEVL